MNQAQEAIAHGANQPIGWWGAGAIIITVIVCGWFGKWMVGKFEEVLEDLKASHAQNTELLVGVILDNSKAFNGTATAIQAMKTEMHEMRTVIAKCPGPVKQRPPQPEYHAND